MKRADLVRYLLQHGCQLLREGGAHSVFFNPASKRTSTVPRHREINDFLCRKICKDLEIVDPRWTLHENEPAYFPGTAVSDAEVAHSQGNQDCA